ncbi:MAG: 1-acyl-sn-glycerol-3-phosphate acyltransferase [Bacteroidetes bacterium]|nr:1-acyl-sn-glycerol-3-phosphate acyltransferase [Bacteroidota bacterium]MBU2586375.1 1-acyl-sn-glycerol-3-phosphate acyltransferase [Bacteroidota bacterium]
MISAIITSTKLFLLVVVTILLAILALIVALIEPKGRLYNFISKVWSNTILWICGVKVELIGKEHLQADESYVYVSNHISNFDIPVVIKAIPGQLRLVFKKELAKIPIFGWQLKLGPYILIDRQNPSKAMQSLNQAIEKIKLGVSVLLFAEGTRSKDGSIQSFKRGAFTLATRSGKKIVPVTIKGTYEILPKKKFNLRSGKVKLIIDKPIEHDGNTDKISEVSLMNEVRDIIVKNYESK